MARIAGLLTALSVVVAACSPGTELPSAASSPQGVSPTAAAATSAQSSPETPTADPTSTPFEFGELDEELVAEYKALGLSQTEAIFLALTRG